MPKIVVTEAVSANPSEVYKLACDMEKYPEYMEDVINVQVIRCMENETLTSWDTKVDGRSFKWIEKDIFDDYNKTITYELIKGDLKEFHGQWNFKNIDGNCLVSLEVEFDLGVPILARLLNPILTKKVNSNSKAMLKAIKEEVEREIKFA